MDWTRLQLLWDRIQIIDTLNRYATSVDTRNWGLFLTCTTEEIVADMVSLGFGEPMILQAKDFLAIIRQAVSAFDRTQHLISNHVIEIDGDRSACVCYFQPQHFRQEGAEGRFLLIGGTYDHRLVRTPEGWRICKYKIVKTWMTSG